MPPNVRTLRYTQRALNFDGGLNLATPPTEIADNELVSCDNFWYLDGTMRKRPGFFKQFITPFTNLTTNPVYILGYDHYQNKFAFSSPGTPFLTFAQETDNAYTSPITTYPVWAMQYVNGTTYFSANGIRTITANVFNAAIANAPGGFSLVWHKSRLWVDWPAFPGRLAFSDAGAPATWQASSTIDIGVGDKDYITGFASLGDLLLVFKNNSIYALYAQGAPVDWTYRKIADVGAPSSYANAGIYTYNGNAYFISKDGLCQTNGSSVINLSKNIWIPENSQYILPMSPSGYIWRITRFFDTLLITGGVPPLGYNYTYNLTTKAWTSWSFLGGRFDDIYVDPYNTSQAGTMIMATKGNQAYQATDDSIANYDAFVSAGKNSYADGFLQGSIGVGSAYTATFQTKEFSSFVDWYWRIKWASLEYTARYSPAFFMIGDGTQQASQSPGYHASLRKGYKIAGAGRCRVFAIKCNHVAISPFEFYRGETHFTLKTHISASGAP